MRHTLAFAQPSTDSVLLTVPHYCLRGHAPISFPLPSCDPYTVSSLHRCVLALALFLPRPIFLSSAFRPPIFSVGPLLLYHHPYITARRPVGQMSV